MRIAVFGTFSNFIPLFTQLREKLHKLGHSVFFVNPRNYDARAWLSRMGIGYYFRERPKRLREIFNRAELEDIVYFQYRMESYFEENTGLKQRLLDYAQNQAVAIDDFLESERIDLLVVWNGAYIDEQLSIRLAQRRGIKIVYMENGFFPRTLQIDPDGINYDNSISSMPPDFFRNASFDDEKYRTFIEEYKTGKVPDFPRAQMFQLDFIGKFFFKYTLLKHRDFKHPYFLPAFLRKVLGIKDSPVKYPAPPEDNPPKPIMKPYILLPLQVHDDSQIIKLSPLVRDMETFVETAYSSIKAEFGDEFDIVVKEHPVDHNRGFTYQTIREKYPDIIWLDKYDIKKALDGASMVVAINSTVGLEALIFNKPVVTLGLAFYNKSGLVFHADTIDDIPNKMREALEIGPDRELVERFLYYLRYEYVVIGNYDYFDQKTVDEMAGRILSLARVE